MLIKLTSKLLSFLNLVERAQLNLGTEKAKQVLEVLSVSEFMVRLNYSFFLWNGYLNHLRVVLIELKILCSHMCRL